jgi:hypothetical protein
VQPSSPWEDRDVQAADEVLSEGSVTRKRTPHVRLQLLVVSSIKVGVGRGRIGEPRTRAREPLIRQRIAVGIEGVAREVDARGRAFAPDEERAAVVAERRVGCHR